MSEGKEPIMDKIEENYKRWLASPLLNEDERKTLLSMSEEEKADAFYTEVKLGTAGMRGVLGPGTNRMNRFTIQWATVGFGRYLLKTYPDARKRGVVISHDNRFFSREFTLESAEILNKMGIPTYIFDSLRPTPELSYAVRYKKAVGGIMITASHNPKQYNGYKVYDETGCQLVPAQIAPYIAILSEYPDVLSVEIPLHEKEATTEVLSKDVDDTYVALVEGIQIHPEYEKKGFKIVYSPQHGTSYENAMRVFTDCGYDIHPVASQCTHDPAFGGTLSPNPETAESFIQSIKLAKEIGADLCVMTDPDGDRCGLAYLSSKGTYERFTGNQSAALLLDYILSERKKMGTLSLNGVMYDTIVTSDLGRKIAHAFGLSNESFLTGFKYIGNRIDHYEKLGHGPRFEFGYEESYGCLIAPFVRDKDGIQAILLYSEMALHYHLLGIPLDIAYKNLEKKYGYHETITDSVFFVGPTGAKEMAEIMDELHRNPPKALLDKKVVVVEDYEKRLKTDLRSGVTTALQLDQAEVVRLLFEDTSWIAIRPSGTEPKCKFYVEVFQKEEEGIATKARALLDELKKELGVKA